MHYNGITGLPASSNIWIGLNDGITSIKLPSNPTNFQWSDGSNITHGTNIISSFPYSINNRSVYFDAGSNKASWIDSDPSNLHRFMCNSCPSELKKYIIIDQLVNWTTAPNICQIGLKQIEQVFILWMIIYKLLYYVQLIYILMNVGLDFLLMEKPII